jgi:hypothetical protein
VKSLPAVLPSHEAPPTEVKPARKPITRAQADAHPPQDFALPPDKGKSLKICGIPLPIRKGKAELERLDEERIKQGAIKKGWDILEKSDDTGYAVDFRTDPEYMDVIRAYHPGFDAYSEPQKSDAASKMLLNHPRFLAGMAQCRNELSRIPNGPTATRKMEPEEQKFLTHAFRRIQEDIGGKPFHIHGELGVTGNREAEITGFDHNPAGSLTMPGNEGDKYHLHTHPPYGEPFTSSAGIQDHKQAAVGYMRRGNKMDMYVTNGKDVLHIQPHSTELVKLVPDPEVEKKLGEFPEAFRVPRPQLPPYPFANHEAPPGSQSRDPS